MCYTRAGDPRNHPVIYGNMYFWQLRYHAKIATPLWGIHKLRWKNYLERVKLDNSLNCDSSGGLREALVDGTVWGILYKLIIETENQKQQRK